MGCSFSRRRKIRDTDAYKEKRIGFNGLVSIDDVTINIKDTSALISSPQLLSVLISNMNRIGVCCLNLLNYNENDLTNSKILKYNLEKLKELFGEISEHQKSDPVTGILTIDPRNPNSINVANTHMAHEPHTDDAYKLNAASILCLACQHNADIGGDTFVICGQSMLQNIVPQLTEKQIKALFDCDAIEIGRKLPSNKENVEYELIQNKRPILSYSNNNNLRLIYRHCDSYVKNVAIDAKIGWDLMTKYCDQQKHRFQFKLKPGHIIIIDNTAFMHGRTPYNKNSLRVLYRLNFFHSGSLSEKIKLGIKTKEIGI